MMKFAYVLPIFFHESSKSTLTVSIHQRLAHSTQPMTKAEAQ